MSLRKYLFILFSILVFQGFGQLNQDPLKLIFEANSVPATGAPLEVKVSYADFDQIASTQYFILWDSMVMEIDTVVDITTELFGLSIAKFVLPEQDNALPFKGKLRLTWDDASGPSLPDSTHIFTMRFNVIGGPCSKTELRVDSIGAQQSQKIEIISGIDFETNIGAIADELPIEVPSNNCDITPVAFNFGNVTGNSGDNICMPLTVMNFDSIDTFGGSVIWDENVLQYTGVQGFGVADFSLSDFGVTDVDDGELTYAWIDDTGMNPETLANGTTLFEICFDIIGNPGTSSTVSVSDMPNAISVSKSGPTSGSPSTPLPFTVGAGGVQVDSGIPDPLGFGIPNLSGDMGSNLCVPVSVTNFDDINSFGGSLLWNSSVMEYTGIQGFGIASFDENDFDVTQAASGTLTYNWAGAPTTLSDGSTLFEVCYNVIGAAGESGDIFLTGNPNPLVATTPGPGGQNIDVPSNSGAGSIRVNNNNTGDAVVFNFPDISGEVGDEICIPLTVDNFTDVISVNGSVMWDANILNFKELGSLDLPGLSPALFNLINAGNGVLTFVWSDPNNTAQTLINGSTIFELCFTVACDDANNNVSIIRMANTPTSITVGQQPDPTMPSMSADVQLNDGSYTVTSGCGGGGGDNIEFLIPDLCIQPGTSTVCVPLTANNFIEVQQLDFSYMWDPTVFTYAGVANANLGGFNPNTMVNPLMADNGKLTFAWIFDPSQGPETIPSGGTIIEFCFDVIGTDGQSSAMEMFSGQGPAIDGLTPIAIGVGPANEPAVSVDDYIIDNGRVSIGDKTRDFVLNIGNVVANGTNSQVCVPMTAEGFEALILTEWHLGFDQTEICFNSITNIHPNIELDQNNNFDLRAPGQLLFSWSSPDGVTGRTIPDRDTIFEVCFDVKAPCGSTVDLDLIIDPARFAVFEIVNESNPNDLVPSTFTLGTVFVDCGGSSLMFMPPAQISNVRCNGENNGSITVNFSGGTAPYTCSWDGAAPQSCSGSSTLSNLGPGAYTLTIMDAVGASISQAYSVSEPPRIVLNATITNETCDQLGSIVLNPSGGTGQLNWDAASLVGIVAGTYRVEVTDGNDCSVVQFFDVARDCDDKGDFSITILEQASCGVGGRIQSNRPPNATVSYSPAIFNLNNVAPGTYEATCDLNGQIDTFRFTITSEGDGPAPRVDNIQTTNAPCEGNQGGFVTYEIIDGCDPIACSIGLWDNVTGPGAGTPCANISSLIPGSYYIAIRDNIGRVDTQFFSILRESGDPIQAGASDMTIAGPCPNDPGTVFLEASGGCGDLSCTVVGVYNGPCNQTITLPSGIYSFSAMDEAGGTFTSPTFEIVQESDTLRLQTEPVASDSCTLALDLVGGAMPYDYVWLDASGDTVSTDPLVQLDPETISPGYIVTVIDGNNCRYQYGIDGDGLECDTIVDPGDCTDPTITVGAFTGGETSCADDQLCSGTVTGLIQQCEEFQQGFYTLTLVDQDNNEFSIEVENTSEAIPFAFEGLCAGSYVLTITEMLGDDTVIAVPVQVIAPEPIVVSLEVNDCDDATCLAAAEISISGGVGGYDVSWMDADGNLLDIILETDSLTCGEDYQIEVLDGNQCVAPLFFQAEMCEDDLCTGATPVITPNGDGLNDNLEICFRNADNALRIYDRWGRLVHTGVNYDGSWSGTDMDGGRLMEGAYYWVLEENNADGINVLKGTVTILRNQP